MKENRKQEEWQETICLSGRMHVNIPEPEFDTCEIKKWLQTQ